MNIAQTRQVMAYIWSTHPSAPKYSNDDKVRTVAAYFRVLYKYALSDVLAAVDAVCLENPTFTPSAYEIEAKCEKRVNVDYYLPEQYHTLGRMIHDMEQIRDSKEAKYLEAFDERARILDGVTLSMLCDAEKEQVRAQLEPLEQTINEFINILTGLEELKRGREDLYIQATWKAYEDYDRKQAQLAQNDLTAIENRALGG